LNHADVPGTQAGFKEAHTALEFFFFLPEIEQMGTEIHLVIGDANRNASIRILRFYATLLFLDLELKTTVKSLAELGGYLEATGIAHDSNQVFGTLVDGGAGPAVAQVVFHGPAEFGRQVALDEVRDLAPDVFATDFDSQMYSARNGVLRCIIRKSRNGDTDLHHMRFAQDAEVSSEGPNIYHHR